MALCSLPETMLPAKRCHPDLMHAYLYDLPWCVRGCQPPILIAHVLCMQVAIKFIQRGEKMAGRYVEREIVNHSMLLHPHIIQFKEVRSLSMPPLNIQQAAGSTKPKEHSVCHDVRNSLL